MNDGKLNIPIDKSNSIEMSVQTYQAIHKMITGRADNITQYYRQPFEIDLNELIQLDKKITQVCTQYQIISANKSFTVYHRVCS